MLGGGLPGGSPGPGAEAGCLTAVVFLLVAASFFGAFIWFLFYAANQIP